MLSFLPRGLTRRLAIAAIGLIVIPWLAVFVATLGATRTSLGPEVTRKTETEGRYLAFQVERALAFGIPLAELYGMDELLDATLAENAHILYVHVLDPDGRIVHSRVAARNGAANGADHYTPTVVLELENQGAPAGRIVLGQDMAAHMELYAGVHWDLALALVISLVLGVEVLRFLAGAFVVAPLRLAETLTGRIADGDFTAVAADQSGGEIGRLLSSLNRLIRRINRRYEELLAYAEDVRHAVFERQAAEEIQQLAAQVSGQRRFQPGTGVEMTAQKEIPLARLTIFLTWTAVAVQFPALLRTFAAADGGAMLISLLAGALAILIYAGRCVDPVIGRLGSRGSALLGAGLAAVPLLLPTDGQPAAAVVVLRLLSALGAAILAHATGEAFGLALIRTRPEAPRTIRSPLAEAVICGAGLAALLAGPDQARAADLAAVGLIGAAGILALVVLRPFSPDRPAATWPDSTELLAILRDIPTATALALVVLPTRAVLAGFGGVIVPLMVLEAGWPLGTVPYALMMLAVGFLVGRAVGARLARSVLGGPFALSAVIALTGIVSLLFETDAPASIVTGLASLGLMLGAAEALVEDALQRLSAGDRRRHGERRIGLCLRFGGGLACFAGIALALLATAIWPGSGQILLGILSIVAATLLAALATVHRFRQPTDARLR